LCATGVTPAAAFDPALISLISPPWRHHNDVAPSRYRRRGIARHCMANENPVKFLPRNAVHPLY